MDRPEVVFNHLVLPAQLPGAEDPNHEGIQAAIIDLVSEACETLKKTSPMFTEAWDSTIATLRQSRINGECLDEAKLEAQFQQLTPHANITLHIVQQNAGLLIRSQQKQTDEKDVVIFESTEVSPSCEAVLSAENALQWDFPGRSVEIPAGTFHNESFQRYLAQFLGKACSESLQKFAAHVVKGGLPIRESRDTVNPALITQMLMSVLEAVGSPCDVPRLRKRVRDDINIDNAKIPWRRLPFWLLLRVSIQRLLHLKLGNEVGMACYKVLITTALSHFLRDYEDKLGMEQVDTLCRKLSYRMSKLEVDKMEIKDDSISSTIKQLLGEVEPSILSVIVQARKNLDQAITDYKANMIRRNLAIPFWQKKDTHLSFPVSGRYLRQILHYKGPTPVKYPSQGLPSLEGKMKLANQFTDRCIQIHSIESRISAISMTTDTPTEPPICKAQCCELAEECGRLIRQVMSGYNSDAEQMSIFVLNFFHVWVQMDKLAVKVCPLLGEYHPVFTPELLDVLQLPKYSDLVRLRNIQGYLRRRCLSCKYFDRTIISRVQTGCFAHRYFLQSPDLQDLMDQIERDSQKSRDEKVAEWKVVCGKYNDHWENYNVSVCRCSVNVKGDRDSTGCSKHWHWRSLRKLEISVHEDFLPVDEVDASAVLFEMQMPDYLRQYRNATWGIYKIAHPSRAPEKHAPKALLNNCPQLKSYMTNPAAGGMTLASEMEKSILNTHFKAQDIPEDSSMILRLNILRFQYYEESSQLWAHELGCSLTFQHVCGIHIPHGLRNLMPNVPHPPAWVDGPSSYQIIVNQTDCPPDMSIQEFSAYQQLLGGNCLRWISILRELASPNLNCSTEDAMLTLNSLVLQAGPESRQSGPLGKIHDAFHDPSFCCSLIEQIESHLLAMVSNWREVYRMEFVLTLILRTIEFTSGETRNSATRLLVRAREITLDWISKLRIESKDSITSDVAQLAAKYGFLAALLCRRTFSAFLDTEAKMSSMELCVYVQASLALQGNLIEDPTKLTQVLKNLLVRDMKMAFGLKSVVWSSIRSNPIGLSNAIMKIWGNPSGYVNSRTFTRWDLVQDSIESSSWLVSTTTSDYGSQVVHYNFVEGHLLVDGKPLGNLPQEIRNSDEVKALFGDKNLRTCRSSLNGMSHMLLANEPGHQIHFGLRNGNVVIRDMTKNGLLEYIPRDKFSTKDNYDLPSSLRDNCVHWLNLYQRQLEIRRLPMIWSTRGSDWIVHMKTAPWQATRRKHHLIDPHCNLAARVAWAFGDFEDPRRLTIFKSEGQPLCVELKHLELFFFVNQNSLLECIELAAEIDPDQDAKTWYGLSSKLVLRDRTDRKKRIIITPPCALVCEKKCNFTVVRAKTGNNYLKFTIDDVLGRITCASEPEFLYSKALFHAATSLMQPDPLTGRTGSEEALAILSQGQCQPWAPLSPWCITILHQIAFLSPQREYYPRDKRTLQTVRWKPHMTTTMQHDCYESVVNLILSKSRCLSDFHSTGQVHSEPKLLGSPHLRRRGEAQRTRYERENTVTRVFPVGKDHVYEPRDRHVKMSQATGVYQMAKLLVSQQFKSDIDFDLTSSLSKWNFIGGFDNVGYSSSLPLHDLIGKDINNIWGRLVDFCRRTDNNDRFKLMFTLCPLALAKSPDIEMLKMLAAFGCVDQLKALEPPDAASFTDFKGDESPTVESLDKLVIAGYLEFDWNRSRPRASEGARKRDYLDAQKAEGTRLAKFFVRQWPDSNLTTDGFNASYIDLDQALHGVLPKWQSLQNNAKLLVFIKKAQAILSNLERQTLGGAPRPWPAKFAVFYRHRRGYVKPSLSDHLIARPVSRSHTKPCILTRLKESWKESWILEGSQGQVATQIGPGDGRKEEIELGRILDQFIKSPDILRRQYGNDIKQSLDAYCQKPPSRLYLKSNYGAIKTEINDLIAVTERGLLERLTSLQENMSAGDPRYKWLQLVNMWPSITRITLLETLRSSENLEFGRHMKQSIINCGLDITAIQKLWRIIDFIWKGDIHKLREEYRNMGHESWSPLEYPDWLLLEIDSDILIRTEQIEVAQAIISPQSKSNSVLQLNMGEGKTSCIMPMAAAILANGNQLVRLIIPKPLLLQAAQVMQSRLGGLLGREVLHVPFSRRTSTKPEMLEQYESFHSRLLHGRGIILTTPETVLAFKLSGEQKLRDFRLRDASSMNTLESWLTTTCRDIIDESDVTLCPRTQLIYPSGSQESLDGHPHRWIIAQNVLSLVEGHLPNLQRHHPTGLSIVNRGDGFPVAHFLDQKVEETLTNLLVTDLCSGQFDLLRIKKSLSPYRVEIIRKVLLADTFVHQELKAAAKPFRDSTLARRLLLILRGLIRDKILIACLKKRWNITYGFHPNRDPIAVPFEGKGLPHEQAEFGHPEVVILLTCLSFYYGGINLNQFREGLQGILNSDDPAGHYDQWTVSCKTLPEKLQQWSSINLDDQRQVEELWKHVRLKKDVINHYLNRFVFPRYAKQFTVKLQASPWDLPQFSAAEEGHANISTGFSGTNDIKSMLPLTIRQDDLPSLQHTNAEVLIYLLQNRNRGYRKAADNLGRPWSEPTLLMKLKEMKIRVLIDAGAYVLDKTNEQLAKEWLEVDPDASGAVYFRNDNKAWFKHRGEKKADVPLLATAYADRLQKCVVYLDQAHTRGTDMKFPRRTRGALTLALGQTKDHTVQAAMRLRELGSTHSVTFIAPPEVHQSILDVCNKKQSSVVDSGDVVHWLLEQTCCGNELLGDLYYAQAVDFCRRSDAALSYGKRHTKKSQREAYFKIVERPERLNLEQQYGGNMLKSGNGQHVNQNGPEKLRSRTLRGFLNEMRKNRDRDSGLLTSSFLFATNEVEQEREVEFQVEEIRHVRRPAKRQALKFPGYLHPDIVNFVLDGYVPENCTFRKAYAALEGTDIGVRHSNIDATNSRIYVTDEFMRSVKLRQEDQLDEFLRPVEWVLWSTTSETALIIIPEEAELLMTTLRVQRDPKVHLFTYTAPVTRNMESFGKFMHYNIPSLPADYEFPLWLALDLGIFAGRLYVTFDEYTILSDFIRNGNDTDNEGHKLMLTKWTIPFLREWLTLRRFGQEITHTPMGYLSQGRQLSADHSVFLRSQSNHQSKLTASKSTKESTEGEEEEEEDDDRSSSDDDTDSDEPNQDADDSGDEDLSDEEM